MIRPYRPSDRAALDAVCLRTGASGDDASDLYRDPSLPGLFWVGPYVELEPDLAFVVDRGEGPEGYVIGALDTREFERRRDTEYLPPLRLRHPLNEFEPRSADAELVRLIHHPMVAPDEAVVAHPSHLHIDLLPSLQGQGWGGRLIDTLLARLAARGSTGVFLGVNAANTRAIGFYRHLGFQPIIGEGNPWLGRRIRG